MSNYILVTGACGGIGSVLVELLLSRGDKVLAIDNLSSGDWSNISYAEGLETRTIDILSDEFEKLPWEDFTHVIHLAAISSLPECQIDPPKAMEVNFLGTVKTATLATKSPNLKTFVNASTSAIYESNKSIPFRESDPVSPHLIYSQSKFFAENFLEALRKDHGFPAISLRFFNVFGPMQNYARKSPPLLNYLVRQAHLNQKPILHSNGLQARDYIDVGDICNAIVLSLQMGLLNNQAIFNLSSGLTLSVNQIVDLVQESLDYKFACEFRTSEKLWNGYPELINSNFPLNDSVVIAETEKISVGDSLLFQQLTGWSPNINQKELLILRAQQASTYMKENK